MADAPIYVPTDACEQMKRMKHKLRCVIEQNEEGLKCVDDVRMKWAHSFEKEREEEDEDQDVWWRVVRSPLRISPLGAHIDHQYGQVMMMIMNKE